MIRSAALYARVSTQIQAEHGHSLSSQIAACKEKAESIGAETVREYIDDGYSGAYLERPALDNMRDALRDHLHDAVVIYDPDRLSRNLAHQLLLTEEFEKLGVKLVFCSTDIQDTPEGKMLYQMRGVFASYEREKFRERSMRGRRSMAKKGLVVQDSYVYGYDFDKEHRQYVINSAEAETIRMIFNLFLRENIGGMHKITHYLNLHNIPSPQGKLWHISTVKSILSRDMYAGEYYAAQYYHTKKDATHEVKIPRPSSEWIKIKCPQIVPKEDIEAAKAMIEDNKTGSRLHYTTRQFLLRGLVYCEHCGRKAQIKSGQIDKKAKDGTRLRYYTCQSRNVYGEVEHCPARLLPANALDELAWETIRSICENKTKLLEYVGRKHTHKKKPKTNQAKEIAAKLTRLATERRTIMSWYSQNLISQEDATDKLQSIKQQEGELKKKLSNSPKEETVLSASDICQRVQSCGADFESKRNVVLSIVDKVYAMRMDTKRSTQIPLEIKLRIVFKNMEI